MGGKNACNWNINVSLFHRCGLLVVLFFEWWVVGLEAVCEVNEYEFIS